MLAEPMDGRVCLYRNINLESFMNLNSIKYKTKLYKLMKPLDGMSVRYDDDDSSVLVLVFGDDFAVCVSVRENGASVA